MDTPQNGQNPKAQEHKPGGLYRNVNISVKALDLIIVACLVLILVLVVLALQDPGHTVTFDPKGGSDVAAVTGEYGQLLEPPEPPVREGYVFTGWFKDYACDDPWDLQQDTIQADTKLYAGWEKTE